MGTPAKTVLALALVAAAFAGGSWYRSTAEATRAAQSGRQILYYACPMHPQYRSDRPGDCPSCGMRLEPVYPDGSSIHAETAATPATSVVQVSIERQQLLGVRIASVQRGSGMSEIRTVGRVAADETRVYRLNAAVEGWIRETGSATTGSFVRKGEVLASYYSPAFLTVMQGYIYAVSAPDPGRAANTNFQQLKNSLVSLGVSEQQLDELAKTHEPTQDIYVYSPVDGIVIARNVSARLYFDRGAEFYRVADLSRVWILADLFENEGRLVRPGQAVSVRYQGKLFTAKASMVPPVFDPATRTLKARFEMDNPGFTLRPDMFVDVELPVSLPAAVTVPNDAVVDSGLKKVVYVAKGDGYFEPRTVETGWRSGDQVEIASGLMGDEQVVVAGSFMLDSESRMRMPAYAHADVKTEISQAQPMLVDPVCGMDVDPTKPAGKREYKGKTYYFCSDHCLKKFDGHPEEYAGNAGK